MSASPRIPTDTDFHTSSVKDHRTANPVVFLFNRRKEILIGTQAKVNPTETIATRAALICQTVGLAAAYYFWLVARINKDGTTRFKIKDAADALGVNRRSIERWNDQLIELGLLQIQNRFYNGQLTYSEYTLLPINGIVKGTDTTTRLSQRPYDKAVVTKRAIKKKSTRTSCSSSPSSPRPPVEDRAAAGRAFGTVAANEIASDRGGDNSSQGFDEDEIRPQHHPEHTTPNDPISVWCQDNYPFLISMNFNEQPLSSFIYDVRACFTDPDTQRLDEEKWNCFSTEGWRRLQLLLPDTFISVKDNRLKPGWLFRFSKSHPNERNFSTILFSGEYHRNGKINYLKDVRILYSIGDIVWNMRHRFDARILRVEKNGYRVCLSSYLTEEEWERNGVLVPFDEIRPARVQDNTPTGSS